MENYVSFPGLGIDKLPINRELFSIGKITVYWYGFLIGIGVLLALIYAFRRAKYFKIDVDRMIDVIIVSLIFSFIGIRFYYIIFDPSSRAEFFKNPMSFFSVNDGGLAIYGGMIAAFLTALWMSKVRKVETLALFDLASLGFLIGQAIGRWGNFFNQEAFGSNTTLPWGMTGSEIQRYLPQASFDPALPVHPTFLYESLWCVLGFIVLHIVSKKLYKFRGQIFSLYLIWYGAGRAVIEGLRTDSLYFGQIRVSQLVAILSIVLGAALFMIFRARHNRLPADLFAADSAQGELAAEDDISTESTESEPDADKDDEDDAFDTDEITESDEKATDKDVNDLIDEYSSANEKQEEE